MNSNGKSIIRRIGEVGVLLVVRCETEEEAVPAVRAVLEGGLRAIEVTFTVPGAPGVIRRLKHDLGESVLLGAGSITNAEAAEDAVDAGASFLVAPNTDERVIGAAKRLEVPMIPGAFTPTEALRAWDLGADAVKIFPVSLSGAHYIWTLRSLLPHTPLIPAGGIDERNVGEYFRAGAFAVGAGGHLFDRKRLQAKDWAGMTEVAKHFSTVVKSARDL